MYNTAVCINWYIPRLKEYAEWRSGYAYNMNGTCISRQNNVPPKYTYNVHYRHKRGTAKRKWKWPHDSLYSLSLFFLFIFLPYTYRRVLISGTAFSGFTLGCRQVEDFLKNIFKSFKIIFYKFRKFVKLVKFVEIVPKFLGIFRKFLEIFTNFWKMLKSI